MKVTKNLSEHNLLKTVSNGPSFLWQAKIKTIEHFIDDTIWMKFFLDIYTFWYEFPFFCHKKAVLLEPVYFNSCTVDVSLLKLIYDFNST